jgi:excisionase family DNA binding protein
VALGVTERTVRRMVEQGLLTNYGTARRILLNLEEVKDVR